MSATLPPSIRFQPIVAGLPIPGGKVFFYAAGTTTPQAVYADDGTTPLANPLTLDANGATDFRLGTGLTYKINLTLADGVTPVTGWPRDNISGLDAVLISLADSTSTALGDALVAVKRTATGAQATTAHAWIDGQVINAEADFGALSNGSDQTAKVQTALNSLNSAKGGTVIVNQGVKFSLKSLTLPKRSNLEYFMDSDTSPGGYYPLATNERVLLAANANDQGIVNEWRMTATFHPGFILDVRKDVAGHDATLGPGQVRVPDANNPARASINISDEQLESFTIIYQMYGGTTLSSFGGNHLHGWRRTVQLNGIGTAQWVSVPTYGMVVTGQTSGAKGAVISVATGYTLVLWMSGIFVAGEKLIDNNETTTATVTTVAYATASFPSIAQDFMRGNWSVGLPPGIARSQWQVGGKSAVQQTRSGAQGYQDETITNPARVWLDTDENGTSAAGLEIAYQIDNVAAASRRLTLRKYDQTVAQWVTGTAYVVGNKAKSGGTIYRCLTNHTAGTFLTDLVAAKWIADEYGFVGAVKACTSFSSAAAKATSSFNVASVVKNAVGDYTINFNTPFVTADYMVGLSTQDPTDYATCYAKTTSLVRVKVWSTGTSTPKDPTLYMDVTCIAGDI